jgi:hypothetical protein
MGVGPLHTIDEVAEGNEAMEKRERQEGITPGQAKGQTQRWQTKTLKPIDNASPGEATSHRAVTTVNAKVASKVSSPEGRAPNRRAKAAWGAEI